jgi:hypothetical protein
MKHYKELPFYSEGDVKNFAQDLLIRIQPNSNSLKHVSISNIENAFAIEYGSWWQRQSLRMMCDMVINNLDESITKLMVQKLCHTEKEKDISIISEHIIDFVEKYNLGHLVYSHNDMKMFIETLIHQIMPDHEEMPFFFEESTTNSHLIEYGKQVELAYRRAKIGTTLNKLDWIMADIISGKITLPKAKDKGFEIIKFVSNFWVTKKIKAIFSNKTRKDSLSFRAETQAELKPTS